MGNLTASPTTYSYVGRGNAASGIVTSVQLKRLRKTQQHRTNNGARMPIPAWLTNYDEGVPPSLEPYPDRTLIDYLADAADKWPTRPALLFKGSTVTYRQLDEQSSALSAAFAHLGIRRGDRVAL